LTSQPTFQHKVGLWIEAAFGDQVIYQIKTRADSFIEEALELYQALGYSKDDVLELVEYVYGRPAGDPDQEFGGVALTLSSLANSASLDLEACATKELDRVWSKIDQIRAKDAAKLPDSPLPGRTESCGNCQKSKPRDRDRFGRNSSVHIHCSLGKETEGNHVRRSSDWCNQWEKK